MSKTIIQVKHWIIILTTPAVQNDAVCGTVSRRRYFVAAGDKIELVTFF